MQLRLSERPFQQTRSSVHLDAIRGIAALLVVVSHLRGMFFVQLDDVSRHRGLLHLPYMVSGMGSECVIVFFVLSGFLVGGTALRSFEREEWSWKRYLTHRFVRLWLVLIPALTLGAVWDMASFLIGMHRHTPQTVLLLLNFGERFNLSTYLGNVFFLQGILVQFFGNNGPLWSLANEFWYYMLFPLALVVIFSALRRTDTVGAIVSAILFVLISVMVGKKILLLAPIWVVGALIHYLPRVALKRWVRVVCSCVFVGGMLLTEALTRRTQYAEYGLALLTAGFVWVVLSSQLPARADRVYVRVARRLASFSFTLYLVHKAVLTLAAMLVLGDGLWQPDAAHIGVACGLLGVVVAYAWWIASLTEFRTDRVRRFVERMLSSKPRVEAVGPAQ